MYVYLYIYTGFHTGVGAPRDSPPPEIVTILYDYDAM